MAVDVSHTKFDDLRALREKRVNVSTVVHTLVALERETHRRLPLHPAMSALAHAAVSARAAPTAPRASRERCGPRAATLASKRPSRGASASAPRSAAPRTARHAPAASRGALVAPAAARFPFPRVASSAKVSAETTVRGMYDAINRRDVEAALAFVDDDILYEDFILSAVPARKAAVRKLFEESCDGIPDDMLFIVDECTDGGGIGVGMTWYVELEGEPFPSARRVVLARRPGFRETRVRARRRRAPAKLGDVSFSIIRAVAPLVKKQLRAQREKRESNESESDSEKASPPRASTRRRWIPRATRSPPPVCTPWARRTGSSCCCPLRVGRVCPASPRGRWRPRRSRRWWPSPPTSSSCCLCSTAPGSTCSAPRPPCTPRRSASSTSRRRSSSCSCRAC